jgi:[protein-PII] uridylyltransferase
VRTAAECAEVAGRELSAGVGLLDLRVVAGDAGLVSAARTGLLGAWRHNARKRLPELLSSLDERLNRFGDAAYLLEPDLKEARGGFRDMTMLRALAATWLTDRPHSGVRDP